MAKRISTRSRKKKPFLSGLRLRIFLVLIFLGIIGGIGYHYREALAYYFSFKSRHEAEDEKLYAIRNFQVMSRHDGNAFGFDVSEYQGEVDWAAADSVDGTFPLDFVFIRATYGKDCLDAKFRLNWARAGNRPIARGAYHYYRPDENSLAQAKNFINNVKLGKGDFPPVLDVEKIPEDQPMDSLIVGLKRWVEKVEKHYGVQPIIYCGDRFFSDYLEEEFGGYTLWIANYNFFVETIDDRWTFWQFTENGRVPGIDGPVDVNIFNGSPEELDELLMK
jgi:lysozyme